jgi:hypothetical protein
MHMLIAPLPSQTKKKKDESGDAKAKEDK